jgi:hypothetical protein
VLAIRHAAAFSAALLVPASMGATPRELLYDRIPFLNRAIGSRRKPSGSANGLLQLGVLRLGFLQDGDVGVGVFPEREEVLICSAGFGASRFCPGTLCGLRL